ncbi:MAG: isoprenoid biosynthesis glyoxalase ElbB [Bacteroidales bacterium]|nr:isoprenoid biosynthesis glyoxalase ElbB [Bacteroidales bacterium]
MNKNKTMMKKVAIILSGCGNRDGSELQETLSLMLALDRNGLAYQCFAPKGEIRVASYLKEGDTGEKRDMPEESARIARGNLKVLTDYTPADYDALALPGGMGAARNLSSYAFDGEKMTVEPSVEQAILATHDAGKPVLAMCIAPMVLAKTLGKYDVILTLGGQNDAARTAQTLGAQTRVCGPTDVCHDTKNRVLTTPAYMVATSISEIFEGAENMVRALLEIIP